MPGIVGLAQPVNQASSFSPLESLLSSLSRGSRNVDHYVDQNGAVAISQASLDTDIHPGNHSTQFATVFLYGEIYHGLEGAASFSAPNILELIANAYSKHGTGFVNNLSGEFLIVILDHKKHCLYLINDRYGKRPVYYTSFNGTLSFASEIKAVLSHPSTAATVDEEALADFLAFGYILGERTLLQNIALLPPAAILKYTIESGSTQTTRYWDIRELLEPCDQSGAFILDDISSAFKTAVERRLSSSDTNWISLSGGMDSRAIAAVADVKKYPVKAVTSGVSGGYERKITAQIAKAIGCKHFYYELDEQQLTRSNENMLDLFKEAVSLTDGMRGTACSAMTAFSARSRKAYGLNAVLTGHGGEIAKLDEAYGFAIRNQQDEQRIADTPVDWAFTRMNRPNGPGFNTSDLYQGTLASIFKDAPRSHLEQIINSLNPDTQPAQLVSFLFLNELFRKRALYALMVHRAYTNIRLPFYDDDFLALVIRAPLSLRTNYKIHGNIIKEHRPELLNIVLSDSRSRPFAGKFERLSRKAPFKIGKKLGLFKRDFPEDFFAANTGTGFFRGILMDQVALDRGLVKPDAVQNLLDLHEKGEQSVYTLLHFLTIIELWHREYLDN